MLASFLRTDRHCFRRVEAMDPVVGKLREWSRMDEELKQKRVRLTNRVRQKLWHYYPQMLDLADDVEADCVLALWAKVSTPAEGARLTEKKVACVLTAHRIQQPMDVDLIKTRCRLIAQLLAEMLHLNGRQFSTYSKGLSRCDNW